MDDSSVVYVDEQISAQQAIPSNSYVGEMQPMTSGGNLPDVTEGGVTEPEVNRMFPGAVSITNQVLLYNNQLKIMASLAQLTASVDILTNKVLSIEKHVQAQPITPVADVAFKPVDSLENLDRLEAELKDKSSMNRHVLKLSTICGTTGKSDGVDCAYRLIDYMATREIVNMCSWTGLARDNTELTGNQPSGSNELEAGTSKIPLKFYAKFRELFFRVVRLADQDFSEASCEKFLKGVMKNSKQRLTSKVTSAHKNRPKNLKYGAKKDDDNNNVNNKQ